MSEWLGLFGAFHTGKLSKELSTDLLGSLGYQFKQEGKPLHGLFLIIAEPTRCATRSEDRVDTSV